MPFSCALWDSQAAIRKTPFLSESSLCLSTWLFPEDTTPPLQPSQVVSIFSHILKPQGLEVGWSPTASLYHIWPTVLPLLFQKNSQVLTHTESDCTIHSLKVEEEMVSWHSVTLHHYGGNNSR